MVSDLLVHSNRLGHSVEKLTRIFIEASVYLQTKLGGRKTPRWLKTTTNNNNNSADPDAEKQHELYLHIQYHPRGIQHGELQHAYNDSLAETNIFDRQIIAYSRPRNLRNNLMLSNLPVQPGIDPRNFITIHNANLFRKSQH